MSIKPKIKASIILSVIVIPVLFSILCPLLLLTPIIIGVIYLLYVLWAELVRDFERNEWIAERQRIFDEDIYLYGIRNKE